MKNGSTHSLTIRSWIITLKKYKILRLDPTNMEILKKKYSFFFIVEVWSFCQTKEQVDGHATRPLNALLYVFAKMERERASSEIQHHFFDQRLYTKLDKNNNNKKK